MDKQEQLDEISKQILVLKRKMGKSFFANNRVYFSAYSKIGMSVITLAFTLTIGVSSVLSAFYLKYREQIIKWIVVGLMAVFVLFILYVIIYRTFLQTRKQRLDREITGLKQKYHEIKNNSA